MEISVRDSGVDAMYRELRKMGYDGLDVSFPSWDMREYILSDEYEEATRRKHLRLVEEGLRVYQTHLTMYPSHLTPIGDGSYEDFEEYMLPIFLRELELNKMLDCDIAVIHLYFDSSRENSQKGNLMLLERLLPTAEKQGVKIAIENIYAKGRTEAYLSTSEDLLFYTEHFKSELLGVCLDTGHAITRGQSPEKMVKELGSSLKALHLHSNVQGGDLHLPPLFTNTMDWQKFRQALSDIGYGGSFNMEIKPPKQMSEATQLLYYRMAYAIAKEICRTD